jgi:hypothetical protein
LASQNLTHKSVTVTQHPGACGIRTRKCHGRGNAGTSAINQASLATVLAGTVPVLPRLPCRPATASAIGKGPVRRMLFPTGRGRPVPRQ